MNRLWKLGTIGVLIGGVAACATVPNPLHPNEVAVLQQAYLGLQQGFITYGQLPKCGPQALVVCHKPAVLAAAQAADPKAVLAIGALERFVRNPNNYPGLTYGGLLANAKGAIATLEAIKAQE